MAQYYYTVSAMPFLTFDGDLRFSVEQFLSFCKDTLAPQDWDSLEKVSLRGAAEGSASETYAAWSHWERSLRGELAKLRSQKKGADSEGYSRLGVESQEVMDVARAAMNEPSPASAEEQILRALWRHLDELEVGHHFDLDKLILYYLRLQILSLKERRNKEAGAKNFSLLYETILKEHKI